MTVLMTQCVGLWRRTLLIESDGTHVADGEVRWLQGARTYVDSRGFAGYLEQRHDVFEWHRLIDLDPPGPFPDVGQMYWDDTTLVERGVHCDYVEHWRQETSAAEPGWALTLTSGADSALLLVVGQMFGWACSAEVYIGCIGSAAWDGLRVGAQGSQIQVDGVLWTVSDSEGSVQL
ncbi:hypothetical protein ABIA30_002994 [Mycobacterium sp. MAA66]